MTKNRLKLKAYSRIFQAVSLGVLITGLAACGSSDNDDDMPPVTQGFQLDIVNLTAGQPFSPVAAIAHSDEYSVFTIGSAASLGLETLAEGGDNSTLISEAESSEAVVATASGEEAVGPGGSESLTLTVEEDQLPGLLLSSVTMLVNSNDAITAISGVSIEGMEVGETRSLNAISYDSGTEANSEFVGTIPGPADGGEGFNAARDDIADEVRMHSGVLTFEGGMADSRLTEEHRWDNPVARFTVTRTQ